MNATQLLAEYLIVGFLTLLGFTEILTPSLDLKLQQLLALEPPIVTAIAVSIAYLIGFFSNVIAEAVFRPLYSYVERKWMMREGNPALVLDYVRYELYINGPPEVIKRIDYHRSFIRISRSTALISFLLVILASVQLHFIVAGIYFVLGALSLFAFQRRIQWLTRTVYFSWLSQSRKVKHVEPRSDRVEGHENIRVAVLAGGTGFREINIALSKFTRNINRIVPVWDNGGSSKILRKHFSVMPIGDVRHALMTMAHGEGRVGSVVKLFNWRLPDSASDLELRNELQEFTSGRHNLIKKIDPSLKDLILTYLRVFEAALPKDMDLRRGSIGNFVLVGAYLAHGNDMNAAIFVFRQICSIEGNVWPISLSTDIHVGARLEDNTVVVGQELVTTLDRSKFRQKVAEIFFTDSLSVNKSPRENMVVDANHQAIQALKNADLIIYGPGSFYTSILPHLMVRGVAETIAGLDVPKVMIANMLECNETYDHSLTELIDVFLKVAHESTNVKRASHKYLTHVIVNDTSGATFVPGTSQRYLPLGENLIRYSDQGINFVVQDLEDPWSRGKHNPAQVLHLILDLVRE